LSALDVGVNGSLADSFRTHYKIISICICILRVRPSICLATPFDS